MGLDRPYFPVSPAPLRMLPRLQPFGKDCGNPAQDRLFFQLDEEFEAYRHAKISATQPGGAAPRERLRVQCPGDRERDAHRAILAWMDRTLAAEQPARFAGAPARPTDIRECWDAIALDVQEDLVALQRTPAGADAVIAVHVCFPSDWRPETTAGWDFRRIHEPVPQFADHPDTARSLADAMIERGPYVRFVWTLCGDDVLDHHPEEGKRLRWEAAPRRGWLRVERQVTVPFPEH
ncbi:MAG: heme-dependent oxidative N-demethylase subunit alpha family protein, partial [Myxococcota bacterium]